ncbi:MAG: hypothetical protein JNL74_01275, partial [Fibrobacteres bacterium]|nr:hypothetical protein [Fibrobacterota bacterium]
ENGQPEFKITSKESIMEHLDDEFKQESSEVMTTNPVQLFQPSNIDIAKLDAKASPVLEAIVSDFLQKNRGVFQYLANS